MARIEKFKRVAMGRLFQHNNRTADDGVTHTNESIDLEKTPNNYYFKKGSVATLNNRLDDLYHQDRENLVVVAEVIVTKPSKVRNSTYYINEANCDADEANILAEEEERKFFKSVYDFYCNDFGEKNIINAVVHKDEITPHIHIDIVPVKDLENLTETMRLRVRKWEDENERECDGILASRDLIDREYLRGMHPRLAEWTEKTLGYSIDILNGATAGGNKTVLELKNQNLENKVSFLEKTASEMADNIEDIIKALDSLGFDRKYFDIYEILMKEQALQYQNEVMLKTLKEHNIPLSVDEIQEIKRLNAMIKTSNFNYKNGILVPDKNSYTLIEGSKINPTKVSPQQAFIESDAYLKACLEKNAKDIKMPTYLDFDKKYVYFPTDTIRDTFDGLMYIREQNKKDHKIKKLSVEKISNDEVGIAEQILKNCDFEVDYYMQRRQKEQQKQQQKG